MAGTAGPARADSAMPDMRERRQQTARTEDLVIWIVSAFFAGAYLGAIAFAAVAAWRDSHPMRRGRGTPPPPVRLWDMEPRTVTHY